VSLAEARTIWSLVKHDEFLLLVLLHKSPHIHHLIDFCGDAIRVEPVGTKLAMFESPVSPLSSRAQSLWSSITRTAHRLSWPLWRDRVKLAVGVLEFVEEIYEHENAGALYLCSEDAETMFRFSPDGKYDTRVVDLSGVRTRKQIRAAVEGRACVEDSECRAWEYCVTHCYVDAGKCAADLVRPNLHRACGIIEEYVILGAPPRRFRAELSVLLDRCAAINSTTTQQLEHSLLLNDLRSLLWNHASSLI